VFGGGYEENEPIRFDKDAPRAVFTSSADWKSGSVLKKTDNNLKVVNTYNVRQKELSSNGMNGVLEQQDWTSHAPVNRGSLQAFNDDTVQNAPVPHSKKVNEDFKQGVR